MLPQAATDHVRAQRAQVAKALMAVRSEWSRMGNDLDASWAQIGSRIVTLTSAAQLGSARNGLDYVAGALEAEGARVKPVADIEPRGLIGLASDGRSLEALLYSAVVRARTAKVGSLPERLNVGGVWLDRIVQTQVQDASRDAAKVAMAVRPGVKYVRMVNPPCCQRCAVLAGEARQYSHPFKRHPGCDCSMIPTTVANPVFAGEKLTAADVTDLTQKQKDALSDGANFHSTINDYQRKRGDFSGYMPPTRVDKVIDRAGQREKALDALRAIGIVV